jgi:acyl-CoA synthetase (AMP-forming)/AMP-acid ligase II
MNATTQFDWSLATVWETIAQLLPDAPAQVQGERAFSWAEFDRRADGIARTLLDRRAGRGDRVAQYLRNSPEYLEVSHAALKIGIPAVNTNYRYGADELRYLWDDADVTAVVFHGSFTDRVAELRAGVPRVRQWIHVDDGGGSCPPWAVPYEQAAAAGDGSVVRSPWGRGGGDLFLLYTGGTTGYPKGVMWRATDMLEQTNDVSRTGYPLAEGVEGIRRTLGGPGGAHVSASPLMHGTGLFGAFMAMHEGGCVVSLTRPGFDPAELLDTIDRHRVASLSIAGEVFARLVLDALRAEPGRWDTSCVRSVLSSGAMLSEASKRGLLEHWPDATVLDGFSSSEGFGMGWSVATRGAIPSTARFSPGPNAVVLDDANRPVRPGSATVGVLALRGRVPLGYYKDPEKSAATFVEVDGVRLAVPGDRATVAADGTIELLGRDSLCINTGGEKVFTEEVEAVLLDHEAVTDVLVVGVPDPRWGQAVTAVVSVVAGPAPGAADLVAHLRRRLAGYKAPKRIVFVESVPRGPNGKPDYAAARELVELAAAQAPAPG